MFDAYSRVARLYPSLLVLLPILWTSAALKADFFTEGVARLIGSATILLAGVTLEQGTLARGFIFPDANLVVLSGEELLGRLPTHGRRRLQRAEKLTRQRVQIDFSELTDGDLVVHLEHGVGRFAGLQKLDDKQEVLVLEFADEAKLYVRRQEKWRSPYYWASLVLVGPP